jgi:hypothetical protein
VITWPGPERGAWIVERWIPAGKGGKYCVRYCRIFVLFCQVKWLARHEIGHGFHG